MIIVVIIISTVTVSITTMIITVISIVTIIMTIISITVMTVISITVMTVISIMVIITPAISIVTKVKASAWDTFILLSSSSRANIASLVIDSLLALSIVVAGSDAVLASSEAGLVAPVVVIGQSQGGQAGKHNQDLHCIVSDEIKMIVSAKIYLLL